MDAYYKKKKTGKKADDVLSFQTCGIMVALHSPSLM